MATPAQNRAAYINAQRHRTPRILSVQADPAGGTMTVVFDRDMDTALALTDNTVFRIVVPDDDLWYDFKASDGYSWTDARTLTFGTSGGDQGAYGGDELYVTYLDGNVSAKGRAHRLQYRERCDRVEII